MEDLYKILDISYDASQDDIKKAFREKSKIYHPDISSGNDEYFKKLSYAYETLSDITKKKAYDNKFFLKSTRTFFEGQKRNYRSDSFNINYNLTLSLHEIFFGKNATIEFERKIFDGSTLKCNKCNGYGYETVKTNFLGKTIKNTVTCSSCNGSGKKVKKEKYKTEKVSLNVEIERGFPIGQYKTIKNVGHQDPFTNSYGDLVIYVHLNKEPNWEVDNVDLIYYTEVDLLKYIKGGKLTIPHFNKKYNADLPSNKETFGLEKTLKLSKLGLYRNGFHGNLYVKVKPKIPKELTQKEDELLKSLCKENNFKTELI